jgi:hypothetical protein
MNISLRFSHSKQVKHLMARAIFCSVLLVLPSCGIPPLRKADTGPGLPAGFKGGTSPDNSSPNDATSPDNSALLRIEEFYNDPMLTTLIHQAMDGNRELKILDQEVQISGNEVLGEPLRSTLNFCPASTSPILCPMSGLASTFYGRWTSGGSCATPGTRQQSASSLPLSGGTTS